MAVMALVLWTSVIGTILTGVIFKGNLLVLSPVLGFWMGTILWSRIQTGALTSTATGTGKTRARCGNRPVSVRSLLLVLLSVSSVAVLLATMRIKLKPHAPNRVAALSAEIQAAEALFQSGEAEAALTAFKALEVPDTLRQRRAQKYHNIGVVCTALGRWSEAEDAFNQAIRYDPEDVTAYYGLSQLNLKKGAIVKARVFVTKALRLNPQHAGLRQLAARCYAERDDQ